MVRIGRMSINLNNFIPAIGAVLLVFCVSSSWALERELTPDEVSRLENNLKTDPQSVASRRFLFNHYFREKKCDKAAAVAEPVQGQFNQKEMLLLFNCLNQIGDGQSLLSSLGYYQSRFQATGTSKYYEALAYAHLARRESNQDRKREIATKAIEFFKESIKLDPLTKDAYFAWIDVLKEFWVAYHEDAISVYRQLETALKSHNAYAAEKCALYLASGSWNEAKYTCSASIESFPTKLESYANLSEALLVTGDKEKAKAILIKGLQRDKKSFPINRAYGNLYVKENNFVTAEEHYSRALASDPSAADVYLSLAQSQFQQKKYDSALKNFHRNCWMKKKIAAEFINSTGQLRDNIPLHARFKSVMSACQDLKPQ